ncbi:hypothetical protein OF83DRAFT_1282963 [Amylostereum chailletii]|nr:hypothetical protein OF83DRAFT_1282963 [Amylostereum chailletii]
MENRPPSPLASRHRPRRTTGPMQTKSSPVKRHSVLAPHANLPSRPILFNTGLLTPQLSHNLIESDAAKSLISPPPEEAEDSSATRSFTPRTRAGSEPAHSRSRRSHSTIAGPSKRKRNLLPHLSEDEASDGMDEPVATPNPKPRKQPRPSPPGDSTPTRPRKATSSASPSKPDLLKSPHAHNAQADYIPPTPSHSRSHVSRRARSSTPVPVYEPPTDRFTPPREVVMTPSPAKAPKVSKSSKRKTLKLVIKKEPPEIDLSNLPPPSPTDDPLLLHGVHRRRRSSTFNSRVTPDLASTPPGPGRQPSPMVHQELDFLPALPSSSPIPPVFDLANVGPEEEWSSSSDDDTHEGEYTGKFRMMKVPTKVDPPTSNTRERIDRWGRPISPFPLKLKGKRRAVDPLDEEEEEEEEEEEDGQGAVLEGGLQFDRRLDGSSLEGLTQQDDQEADMNDISLSHDSLDHNVSFVQEEDLLSSMAPNEDDEMSDLYADPPSPTPSTRHNNYAPVDESPREAPQSLATNVTSRVSPGPNVIDRPLEPVGGDSDSGFDSGSQERSIEDIIVDVGPSRHPSRTASPPPPAPGPRRVSSPRRVAPLQPISPPRRVSPPPRALSVEEQEEEEEEAVDRHLSEEPEQTSQSEHVLERPIEHELSQDDVHMAEPQAEDEQDSDDSEGEGDADSSVIKIVSDNPWQAARAAAILKQHDYDLVPEDQRKRSRPSLDSIFRKSRRSSLSNSGIVKSSPRPRQAARGVVVNGHVIMPGSPSMTLPQLLHEAESDIGTPARDSHPLAHDDYRTPSPGHGARRTQDATIVIDMDGPREWNRNDWKLLDACFTDERLEVAARWGDKTGGMGDVDAVELDDVVDRFVDFMGGQDVIDSLGLSWTRQNLLKRARALQKKQRTGSAAPPTPSLRVSSVSSTSSTPTVPNFTPVRRGHAPHAPSQPKISAPAFPLDSKKLPTTLMAPRYSHLLQEAVSVSKHERRDSQEFFAPTPESTPPLSASEGSSPPPSEVSTSSYVSETTRRTQPPSTPSMGSRVRGFFYSYLPTLSKPKTTKKSQPAAPGLPLPPPEKIENRGPVNTPASKPHEKPTHPKELVDLHPAPAPATKIPQRVDPRRLVDLRHIEPETEPGNNSLRQSESRRSSSSSVRDLVRSFEDLDRSMEIEREALRIRRMKSTSSGELQKLASAGAVSKRPTWKL